MSLTEQDTSIELEETQAMDRTSNNHEAEEAYEPLLRDERNDTTDEETQSEGSPTRPKRAEPQPTFSWIAYLIFLLLGIAMLWPWNMFLAAAPYFQHRFGADNWILNHFQAAEVSVSSLTNLSCIVIFGLLQKNASYPKRIVASLLINVMLFGLLSLSTTMQASPPAYFGFLLVMIFGTSFGTGLLQNGIFSFLNGFGRSEYIQAVMTGQAVAGVLPTVVQIVAVMSVPAKNGSSHQNAASSKSAAIYFTAAAAITLAALVAFLYLLYRKAKSDEAAAARRRGSDASYDEHTKPSDDARKSVPYATLFRKIPYLSLAVFVCFSVTMVFPVFTTVIQSVKNVDSAVFIPVAFLFWNSGDLIGRLITLVPKLQLTHYPFALFCAAMARLLFIPLYFLCNIKGRGAVIPSDFYYLVVVQLMFGITNGYVGSTCMMAAGHWVSPDEREAAGGFMAMFLVLGLTVGSFLSFSLGNI